MINLTKYKYPIICSLLSLTILLTFQHCGKDGSSITNDTSSSPSSLTSSTTSPFPNRYFTVFNVNGTDTLYDEIEFKTDKTYREYSLKVFNGNYDVVYYRVTKGVYTYSTDNKLNLVPTEATCSEDMSPLMYSITGTDFGNYVMVTVGSTSFKFFNYLSWKPAVDDSTIKVLSQDTNCNML